MFSVLCFGLLFFLHHPTQLESTAAEGTRSEKNEIRESTSTASSMSESSNPLTSHVLDTAIGRPAVDVTVTLSKYENGQWQNVSKQLTNSDGRIGNLISSEEFTPSKYKLRFETRCYFEGRGDKTFYPYIEVVFEIEKLEEHYHVPVLISPYGYSTYRGS